MSEAARPRIRLADHPLAPASGAIHVSRVVLWEKLRGQNAPCHWCDRELIWKVSRSDSDALCVDHVDGDTENNDAANLVPSCRGCNANRARGFSPRTARSCAQCGQSVLPASPHPKQRFCSRRCSSIATAKRGTTAPHGTRSRYVFGCRCDECKAENSRAWREWNQSRRSN
jgi:hypothetical protein